MGRIINIEDARNDAITINRSEDFVVIAQKISNHLNNLPLDSEQHNRLVELIVEQVAECERTAFKQGVDLGVKIGKRFEELKEETP